jgi:hypothetical protein
MGESYQRASYAGQPSSKPGRMRAGGMLSTVFGRLPVGVEDGAGLRFLSGVFESLPEVLLAARPFPFAPEGPAAPMT